MEERRWWDIDFTPREDGASEEDMVEEVRELLSDATRLACAPTSRSARTCPAASIRPRSPR